MSNFSGINNFGSLTTSNGQKLTFKDFDLNDDGKITEEEYNQVLKDIKLDSVELSTIDRNGDKEITEDEFKIWEQKQQMQEAVNNLAQEIAIDFAGDKSKYIPELTSALKDFIDSYANDYTGAISEMAKMFEKRLPEKYAEISANILANDPSTIATNVLNEIIDNLNNSREDLPDATIKALSTQLDSVAQSFIKSYTGNDLGNDLRAYLNDWLTKTDKEKLDGAISTYQTRIEKFGSTIESRELASLKECVKQLLTEALDNGIEVKLGEQKVSSTNITAVLNKYTDGEKLKADIQSFIDNLSTVNKKEQIIADEAAKAEAAAEKAFTDIPGSAYKIDGNLIDYSAIKGYANNAQIHERGKGWSGSKDKAVVVGRNVLNNESLKTQMREQIKKMLEAKGVPFDKVASIFENVYSQSIEDTLNADGVITGRGARGLSSKGHAYINIKNLVDTFITTFNTNIEKAINSANESNKDFDLNDIDFTAAVTNEEGKVSDKLLKAMQTGETIKTKNWGKKNPIATKEAESMVERLKSQMLQKAMNMCKANGIEFDNVVFTTIFNNAKNTAIGAGAKDSYINIITTGYNLNSLNPSQVLKTFATEFKTNYTNWVEKEKAANNNK